MVEIYSQYSGEDYLNLYKYILSAFIIFGILILRIKYSDKDSYRINDRNLLIIFVSFIIILVGNRGVNIGTDTINYYRNYYLPGISFHSNPSFFFHYFETDFLFKVLMYLCFYIKSFNFFLLVAALIFNSGLYIIVNKYTHYSQKGSSLVLFLLFASLSSFWSLEINIIRNGLSFVFILFGLLFLTEKKAYKCTISLLIAYLFHSTALIPILAIIIIYFSKKIDIKYFIILYLCAIILSGLGYGLDSLPFLSSLEIGDFNRLNQEIDEDIVYRVGFRIDFVLYNSFFLFLALRFNKANTKTEEYFIRYFIITSMVFFLNFNIPFSDRIGLYSWMVIPFILFNILRNAVSKKHLYYSIIVCFSIFIINYYIII